MLEARALPAVRLVSIPRQRARETKRLHIGASFELSERSRDSRRAQGSHRVGFQTADRAQTSSVRHAGRAYSVGELYFLWAIACSACRRKRLIPARTAPALPGHRTSTALL